MTGVTTLARIGKALKIFVNTGHSFFHFELFLLIVFGNSYFFSFFFPRLTYLSSCVYPASTVDMFFHAFKLASLLKTAGAYKSRGIHLSSHKVEGLKEIVEAKGRKIEYLPPYSPDLNPVENLWSKVKGYLRKVKEGSQEALFEAIGAALRTVTAQDAQGWFKYRGYFS